MAERGRSFSARLDETRCKVAKHGLEETDMRIAQVAYMAGSTEAVALVRAFRRWTSATPMQFRDRSRASMLFVTAVLAFTLSLSPGGPIRSARDRDGPISGAFSWRLYGVPSQKRGPHSR